MPIGLLKVVEMAVNVTVGGAGRDRLRRVDDQVEEHLAKARRAGEHRRHLVEVAHHLRAVLEVVAGHRQRHVDQAAHVDRRGRRLIVLGQREQLLHHPLDPLGAGADVAQHRLGLGGGVRRQPGREPGQRVAEQLGVAGDEGQRVVDLVGGARRQRAQRG